MQVDLTAGDGSAEVEIRYVLSGALGTGTLTLELLGFDSATATDAVHCCWTVDEETVVLWPTTGSHRAASIPVPVVAEAEDHLPSLRLRYRVAHAVTEENGAVHGRIPVLSVDLPPVGEGADVFSASLVLPASWVVTEGFPTGLARGDEGAWGVSLPVVPAMVSVRARSDGTWRPGAPLLVDILAAVVLLLAGFLGWRHLRKLPS